MNVSTTNYWTIAAVTLLLAFLTHTARAQNADEPSGFREPTLAPDLILINGKIWTGVQGAPEAQAIAVRGRKIVFVGATEPARKLAGDHTELLDLAGRRVIPGITDSHTHFIWMGLQLSRLDLRLAQSREDFINAVAAAAVKLPPGKWLEGGSWTVESWPDPAPPCKEWIDPVTPGNPVFLTRTDGHQALVNSVALKYARIDADGPPDPPGGEIERDPETGEPTGILKDDAMALVSKHVPPPDKRTMYDALMAACQVANAWGVTAIHDMSTLAELPVLAMAERRNTLTVRVRCHISSEDFAETMPAMLALASMDGGLLEVAGFKAFMDGSLGSRTAYMRAPFADAGPDDRYPRGMRLAQSSDLDKFAAALRWAHDRDQQLAVHAIGDQANHELLDIYAALPDVRRHRHRIEHAQHLLPADIARFARLGVVASMQPLHKADDGRWAEKAIGPARAQTAYAFKSLLDGGAVVAFGSDCPVVTMNPYAGIAAAVTARTYAGDVWVPEQRITREQALRCYTVTPAWAGFAEDRRGTLEVGKLADLVVLDTDILEVPIERIEAAEAMLTMLAGRIVYRKPGPH